MPKIEYISDIRTEFTDLSFNRSRIIRHGWDNDVVILDESIVFRFPKKKVNLKQFQRELRLLEYLKEHVNISVPEYLYIPSGKRLGGVQADQRSKTKKICI